MFAVSVSVLVPEASGEKLAVRPGARFVAVRTTSLGTTAPLADAIVIVEVAVPPRANATEVGDAVSEKVGEVAAVTLKSTMTRSVSPSALRVNVTGTGALVTGAVALAVKVTVSVKVPPL